jgi:hypothetical protein
VVIEVEAHDIHDAEGEEAAESQGNAYDGQ